MSSSRLIACALAIGLAGLIVPPTSNAQVECDLAHDQSCRPCPPTAPTALCPDLPVLPELPVIDAPPPPYDLLPLTLCEIDPFPGCEGAVPAAP